MTTEKQPKLKKSEILFLYESKFSQPNGDPFTNEQRYDEATKQILVSDVRIKRFIRDYLHECGHTIFVLPPKAEDGESKTKKTVSEKQDPESGSARRFDELKSKFKNMSDRDVLFQCIDAKLFGAVVTIKGSTKKKSAAKGQNEAPQADEVKASKAFNVTGPVQFALLNPSLNQIDLRPHQNTSRFVSRVGKGQGAIATTSLVPYSLNQIHGWINPYSAEQTNLTQNDIDLMFSALWHSVNSANTRSKCNQGSLLLLQIVYTEPHKKIYDLDRLIKLKPKDKREEQVRWFADYELDLGGLLEKANDAIVERVLYYTENDDLKNKFKNGEKFRLMTLSSCQNSNQEDGRA